LDKEEPRQELALRTPGTGPLQSLDEPIALRCSVEAEDHNLAVFAIHHAKSTLL
jgi:hypothetical protein